MSYIPDCRTDEVYNFKNLNEENKIFVNGFDYCMSEVVENAFDNIEDIELDADVRPSDIRKTLEAFLPKLKEWVELGRNELIVSILDEEFVSSSNKKETGEE